MSALQRPRTATPAHARYARVTPQGAGLIAAVRALLDELERIFAAPLPAPGAPHDDDAPEPAWLTQAHTDPAYAPGNPWDATREFHEEQPPGPPWAPGKDDL